MITSLDRKTRPASSIDADRGSNGSVAGSFAAANGAAAARSGSVGAVSPFNSAASRQSSGGLSGGSKSQSFATYGSGGPLGDQPAACVPPAARAPDACEPIHACASNSTPSRPNRIG